MISLSSEWLDPGGTRSLIEAIPPAAALLPLLAAAHRFLLKTQAKPKKVPAEIAAIRDEQLDLDSTHDRKARGLYDVLTGFAELVNDRELAAQLLALRDKIFPPDQGLRVIQATYDEEAGEAKLVEERLDDDDRAFLKKLTYPEGKLSDAHRDRIKAATTLGELEQKKKELEGDDAKKETVKQADVLKARNGWIQNARALENVIKVAKVSAATRKRILGPLLAAEAKAAKNGRTKPDEEPEDGAEEPVEDDAGTKDDE